MIKGFKEFILRGNVVDLAVAVVIGAAFTGIVSAIVNGLINPLIALFFQADSINGVVGYLPNLSGGNDRVPDRPHLRRRHQLHRGRSRGLLRVRLPDEPAQGARRGQAGHRAKRPKPFRARPSCSIQIRDLLEKQTPSRP